MFSSITEGSLVSTGMTRPREERSKISPVWPVQYGVVPAPSVEGPVAQLDGPAGPPVPASVTIRPALHHRFLDTPWGGGGPGHGRNGGGARQGRRQDRHRRGRYSSHHGSLRS